MRFNKIISIFLTLTLSFALYSRDAMKKNHSEDSSLNLKGEKVEKNTRAQYDGNPTVEARVHRAGMLRLCIQNNGLVGNAIPAVFNGQIDDPCTNKNAASGEMPAESGVEFLFIGGLWFGGYLDSAKIEVGPDNTEVVAFQGPLVSTSSEGWSGTMTEVWPVNVSPEFGNYTNGKIVESSTNKGKQNCLFEDIYDPTATAEEQFDVMYSDKYVSAGTGPTNTGLDPNSQRNHIPLGVEVRQKSYAWSYEYAQKFVILDYTLYNRSEDAEGNGRDIYNFFMAEYLDMDIGDKNYPGIDPGNGFAADDMGGFYEVWEDYYDEAAEEYKPQVLNLAWAADNDGRHYLGDPGNTGMGIVESDGPIEKENGIVTIRVLRNPNPNLEFSFNNYTAETIDDPMQNWGPRWKDGYHDFDENNDEAIGWTYDLTPKQLGYDDGTKGYGVNDQFGFLFSLENCLLITPVAIPF